MEGESLFIFDCQQLISSVNLFCLSLLSPKSAGKNEEKVTDMVLSVNEMTFTTIAK
jgi:hypothetical protein